jgi:serine/threonine-protein kinase ATR
MKAHQALYFLATITHGRPTSSRGTARKANLTGPFFETYVLGIMANLADTINDGKGPQPISEKRRCLGGIKEMIELAEGHIVNGLPQVRSQYLKSPMYAEKTVLDLRVFAFSYRESGSL